MLHLATQSLRWLHVIFVVSTIRPVTANTGLLQKVDVKVSPSAVRTSPNLAIHFEVTITIELSDTHGPVDGAVTAKVVTGDNIASVVVLLT